MNTAEWVMLVVLAGLAVYDLKTKTVPVGMLAIATAGVLIYRFYIGINFGELIAGLVPGLVTVLLAMATKESIGIGDGLTLCLLGLFCGWKQCLAVLGMALLLTGGIAVILLVCRKAGRKTEIPFLPCLFGGVVWMFLW